MPRIRQYESKYLNEDFARELRSKRGYYDLKQTDIAEASGICQASVSNYIKNPERLGIKELRAIIQVLHLSPESVLRFLGYNTREINAFKEAKS